MGFNLLINSRTLEKNFVNDKKIFLFLSYFDMNIQQLFILRLFIKNYYKMQFYRLNTKQFNRIMRSSSKNDVVFKINNKNCELTCLNLSMLTINNLYDFFLIIEYFLKFSDKLNILYIKIFNIFLTFNYFVFLLQYFLKSNILHFAKNKELMISTFLKFSNYIKIIFYNFFFILKILFYFKMQLNFYIMLIC